MRKQCRNVLGCFVFVFFLLTPTPGSLLGGETLPNHSQARQVDTGVWRLPICVGEESRRGRRQWAEGPAEPDVRPEGDLPLLIVTWALFLLCI